jgi:hypothetical protein
VNGSLPGYLARRFALLVVTLVLVPSLSFLMFTLIQGDSSGPLDVLDRLAAYLSATFLRGDFGSEHFQYDTFIRTQSALDVVKDGFLVDCYLLGGALVLAVAIGLLAGTLQATRPRSVPARGISILTAFVLSSPVYWLGLMLLLLFAPGIGSVVQIPFLSTVGGYRDPSVDLLRFIQGIWLPCLIVGAPLAAACVRAARRLAPRAARVRGSGGRARRREHEPDPHEPRPDRGRVQHPRLVPLHRARADQSRRRPRPSARVRVHVLHRRGQLRLRRDPGLAGPARADGSGGRVGSPPHEAPHRRRG